MESSQVMNHQEAENTKAIERYLLREMTNEERIAFEDHYLDCAECLEAVTFGADFLDSGHELAEEKGRQHSVALPWYSRIFSGSGVSPMLRPAPAIALTAAVALAVFSAYQQKRITNQQNLIADLKAPSQEFRYVVSGAQRRGSNAIVLSRNERLSLLINFVPKHEFTSYRAEITGPGLPTGYSVPVAVTEQDYSVMVSLPAAVLTGGDYQVNFLGRVEGGEETKLVSNSFEVKLKN